MIENGLWVSKKGKKKRTSLHREKSSCIGELIQVDGSEHAWLEDGGPKSSLLVYVDAAFIKVCSNKRIKRNKIFKGLAKIGKTTTVLVLWL